MICNIGIHDIIPPGTIHGESVTTMDSGSMIHGQNKIGPMIGATIGSDLDVLGVWFQKVSFCVHLTRS